MQSLYSSAGPLYPPHYHECTEALNAFESLASGHFPCSHYLHNTNQSSFMQGSRPFPRKVPDYYTTQGAKKLSERGRLIFFFSCDDTVCVGSIFWGDFCCSPPTMFPQDPNDGFPKMFPISPQFFGPKGEQLSQHHKLYPNFFDPKLNFHSLFKGVPKGSNSILQLWGGEC